MKKMRVVKMGLSLVLATTMIISAAPAVDPGSVIVIAAETQNQYASKSDTHGARENSDGTVTVFIDKNDECYESVNQVWYKEYSSYEEAAENYITNGGNFIALDREESWPVLNDKEEKVVNITVADTTKAILYYINTNGARPDYESIIVLGDADTPSETESYVNFETGTASTYRSENDGGWGGDQNVTFDFSGNTATITGDRFGGSAWAVQWGLKELTATSEDNALAFDITSERDGILKYKLITDEGMTDIPLVAGETKHVVIPTSRKNVSPFFDLSFLGEGTTIVKNMKFAEYRATGGGEQEEGTSQVPAYTKASENLATTFEAIHEDWVEWSSADVTSYDNNSATFDISGYEGYEAYQTRVQAGLTLEKGKNYVISYDITSSKDKKTMLHVEDPSYNPIVEDYRYEIKANTRATVTLFTGKMEETVEAARVFAGLGMIENNDAYKVGDHFVTIQDFAIYEIEEDIPYAGYCEKSANENGLEGGSGASQGKEHDFLAKEDNAANDYADPGLTKDGYELIWADEFDGNYEDDKVDPSTGLNLNNWAYQLGDGSTDCGNYGWGNNELQCYTNDKKNIAVNEDLDGDQEGDGVLRITASYEDGGYVYGGEGAKKYTSARIRTTSATEGLFNTTYGYIEARIALPATQGAWPAFWMLPQSTEIYGGWPVSGELDIMETTGTNVNQACGTLHWGAPAHVYKGSGYVELDSDISYFHTYAVDWEPGQITWYYDGKAIKTLSNWESGFAGASDELSFDAPFDQPFYILLNLAVDSGQFGGTANKANFKGDINMYVDYVRCFQKTEGYAESVDKTASGAANDNWKELAGINQIAEIAADNLDATAGGHNDAAAIGTDKWYLSTQNDASASATAVVDADGKVWHKVDVAKAGGQDYSVQLIGHYNAKAGYVYKVNFDAYAQDGLVGKTVNCDSKEYAGWSTYGISQFVLKDEAESYSFLIDQTEDFENCRIEFNLGAAGTGSVYLSNVKVEVVDPDSLAREESKRGTLADGNFIYNGSFDQGSGHFGYWRTDSGTDVSIPRYTTEKIAEGDVSVVDIASKTNYEKIADGVKYYERRAQISAEEGKMPRIFQPGMDLVADTYIVHLDVFAKEDTTVSAGIYTTTEKNGEVVLKDRVAMTTVAYKAANGMAEKTITIELKEDVADAALVLMFGKDAEVQVDNVSMYGVNQGPAIDENPLGSTSSWKGDNGGGVALAIDKSGDEYALNNAVSGGTWYSPQIISDDFKLVAGQKYTVSFDYVLEGNSNRTFQYIIQENGGSWKVYNGSEKTVTYDGSGDFEHYETTFVADATLENVHLVFGLGNSAADNATFRFKNVSINLVKAETGEGEKEEILENPQEPEKDTGDEQKQESDKTPGDGQDQEDTKTSEKNQTTGAERNPASAENGKAQSAGNVETGTVAMNTARSRNTVTVQTESGQAGEAAPETAVEETKEETNAAEDEKVIAEGEDPLAATAATEENRGNNLPILFAVLAGIGVILAGLFFGLSKKKNK